MQIPANDIEIGKDLAECTWIRFALERAPHEGCVDGLVQSEVSDIVADLPEEAHVSVDVVTNEDYIARGAS